MNFSELNSNTTTPCLKLLPAMRHWSSSTSRRQRQRPAARRVQADCLLLAFPNAWPAWRSTCRRSSRGLTSRSCMAASRVTCSARSARAASSACNPRWLLTLVLPALHQAALRDSSGGAVPMDDCEGGSLPILHAEILGGRDSHMACVPEVVSACIQCAQRAVPERLPLHRHACTDE